MADSPLCELPVIDGALAEHESCEVLSRYGVLFAARRRAATPEGAAAAVRELGAPVVVKTDGPAHKAREGGVRLGITSPEQAAAVARELGGSVLVARQVPAGEEVFCGAIRDPTYGPVIALGRGGVDIEQRGNAITILGPLSLADAALVIADADLPDPHGALARAAAGVSRLLQEHPAVHEVDINPLIVTPEETIAVDGLIIAGTYDSDPREV
jgi:succinyl-CoA synthetase beta subunit